MSNRLELATKSAHMDIWDWDVHKKILTWGDQMYRLYGIPKERFSGTYEVWTAALHPEDKNRSDEAIQLALQGQKEFNI